METRQAPPPPMQSTQGLESSPFGSSAGVPMSGPPMGAQPPRVDMPGPPQYPPPYVLVPASALQYLPGYAQQMMPHGMPSQPGFSQMHYGSPTQFSGDSRNGGTRGGGAGAGAGGYPMQWTGSQAGGAPSSPDGTNSAIDALTDSMHSVSFSSPDVKRSARSAPRRKAKKPCVEDLEEARQRTIYVSDLNKGITETELVRWFSRAGHVLECRICSDMNTSKRFAFVEFSDQAGFEQGITMSGEKLNGSVIKVSPSKTPIVPINRDFMPRDERELERCERTVYVNQIDRAVPGSAVEAMFENTCGDIEHVKMKLDKQHNTRIAFIEFKTNDAAKTALGMCGAQLGSSQIRVSPSKTPVRVHPT